MPGLLKAYEHYQSPYAKKLIEQIQITNEKLERMCSSPEGFKAFMDEVQGNHVPDSLKTTLSLNFAQGLDIDESAANSAMKELKDGIGQMLDEDPTQDDLDEVRMIFNLFIDQLELAAAKKIEEAETKHAKMTFYKRAAESGVDALFAQTKNLPENEANDKRVCTRLNKR